MAKTLLIICQSAPWSGSDARETLDIALAGASFDLPIDLLFINDGVYQLLLDQKAVVLEQKDLSANLQALPLFGVNQLYVPRDSLEKRYLSLDDLALPVQVLDMNQLSQLTQHYDVVVNL